MTGPIVALVAFGSLAMALSSCGGDDGSTRAEQPTPTTEVEGVTQVPTTSTTLAVTTPTAAATEAPASPGGTYTVQAGDTLGGIAANLGVSLDELIAANNITDANLIVPGQELIVP